MEERREELQREIERLNKPIFPRAFNRAALFVLGEAGALGKPLVVAMSRFLREENLAVLEAMFELAQARLPSWKRELARIPDERRRYAAARDLVEKAYKEARVTAQNRLAGLRVFLERTEWALEAIGAGPFPEEASSAPPAGAPKPEESLLVQRAGVLYERAKANVAEGTVSPPLEPAEPVPSVPEASPVEPVAPQAEASEPPAVPPTIPLLPPRLATQARRTDEWLARLLGALDRLRAEPSPTSEPVEARRAAAPPLPDPLPEEFVAWVREKHAMTWAVKLKDRQKVAALWTEWWQMVGERPAEARAPDRFFQAIEEALSLEVGVEVCALQRTALP